MGKLNEIQQETTQSWGSNSFTTTIKEDTVEFDSVKDKFTFKDEVEVPSLKVNGETVSSQVQADWNQNNNEEIDFVKNRTHYVETGYIQIDSESVEIDAPNSFSGIIQSFTGEIINEAQYTIELNGTTYSAQGWNYGGGEMGISYEDEVTGEEIGIFQSRPIMPKEPLLNGGLVIGDSEENDSENRWVLSLYDVTISNKNVLVKVTDSQQTIMVNETIVMECDEGASLTFDETISEEKSYKVSIDGTEYETTVISGKGGNMITCDGVFQIESGYINIKDLQYTGKTISLVISEFGETVHTIADKYISSNIARVSDIPTVTPTSFKFDETNGGIIPDLNASTSNPTAETSCAVLTPNSYLDQVTGTGNIIVGGAPNTKILGGAGNIILGGTSTVTISNNASSSAYIVAGGSSSISGGYENIIMGSDNSSITNGTKCVAIGGAILVSESGVQGAVRIGGYGGDGQAVLNSAGSYCIGGSGMGTVGVNAPGSGIIGNGAYTSTITGAHSMIIGGNSNEKITTGDSNIILNGSSTEISASGNTCWLNSIINSSGVKITGEGSVSGSTILSSSGSNITANQGKAVVYSIIIGGSGNNITETAGQTFGCAVVGGSGNTVSNCSNSVVLGGSGITATESNTVYVPTLKATTGVSTKKLTISSIDPTDVFMHSEIIDASSDVSFSRVLANTSSTKTDGYVEILYKASSGVTCSAYIDSTDVTLTADGGWHKLEQGCDPAHGVEIHINNSSPVTDATLEVISKVYYI